MLRSIGLPEETLMAQGPSLITMVPSARRWHVIDEIDLVRMIRGHRRRAALCDRLEALADALPVLPSPDSHACLARDVRDSISRREREELVHLEAQLGCGRDPLARLVLERIRRAHLAHAAMAEEAIAALDPAARERLCAEALGYLLRGVFTAWRRAIDYEQLAIPALAGARMTAAAREQLAGAIAGRAAA